MIQICAPHICGVFFYFCVFWNYLELMEIQVVSYADYDDNANYQTFGQALSKWFYLRAAKHTVMQRR